MYLWNLLYHLGLLVRKRSVSSKDVQDIDKLEQIRTVSDGCPVDSWILYVV